MDQNVNPQPLIKTGSIKTINWNKIVIAVLSISILMGVSFYIGHEIPVKQDYTPLLTTNSPTPIISTTPSTLASPTSSSAPSMKTYNNSQYGFQFSYPQNYSATTPSSLYISPYFLGQPIITIADPTSTLPVTGNYTQEESISVSQSSNITQCYKDTQNNSQMVNTKIVNGTTYYYDTEGSGAAGHESTATVYRTVKGQICYEINLMVQSATDMNNISQTQITASENAANSELNQIFSTFKFTK